MLSGKLIHLIEAHEDQILNRVLGEIRCDAELSYLNNLPEPELREWGQNILHNLDHWLSGRNERELARHYEQLGRTRYEEDVPLRESIRGLCILKQKMLDFVEEHQLNKTMVELYAEEELSRRIGRFFDLLICAMVSGYERALRRAAHV